MPDFLTMPRAADAADPAMNGDETRRLPRNIDAEAAFLGAVLIDNRILEEAGNKLAAEHFFEPLHQRLYDRICDLVNRNVTVTPVTLKPYFENDEAMQELGGVAYLARLTGSGAGLLAARDLAAQIYDLALLRQLVTVGRNLVEDALDTSEDVAPLEQIGKAEQALYEVAEGQGGDNGTIAFRDAALKAIEQVERARNSGGHLSGVTTGLNSVNDKIGGLHNSDLLILAGRPGMGKTSLATNIAYSAAARWLQEEKDGIELNKRLGAPTAFFSLEMSADQLATRVMAEQSRISSEALRMGRINADDFAELSRAAQRLYELPLYIDDTPALTIASLRQRARRLKRQKGIGLIIIDYLQLLQGSGRAQDNRVNEISEISRGLKTLAKELDVPVLALSQLSRAVEQREDKRPQLSDLRESGSIEQDADMVLFVFREDYYVAAREPQQPKDSDEPKIHEAYQKWQEDMERIFGVAELIVAKQRHGATGKVRLKFESRFTLFTDLADDPYGFESID